MSSELSRDDRLRPTPSLRIIGTETEYGIYRPGETQDPVWLSTEAVGAYADISRRSCVENLEANDLPPVRWDYTGEDPLNDLRGVRLSRLAADPSLLTDDPYHLAPPGGAEVLPFGRQETSYLPAATSAVLPNGARLYVDHAHPEYSGPETCTAKDAVLWDRAGDVIAQRIMEAVSAKAAPIVLVKNNTDGKGAAYGSHENYLMRRDTDFDDLVRAITPFLVTRPVICGAGRVGLGQTSEEPGFQISQRADFVENHVGLETTFNRPIINTRDEAHADPTKWRRFHVIGGDANQFDISTYLRVGTTSLVLWAIEQGTGLEWDALTIADPVPEVSAVSHDVTLTHRISTMSGASYTALEMQRLYLDLVRQSLSDEGITLDEATEEILNTWDSVITRMSNDLFSVATEVEWVAKYQLLERQRQRLGVRWDDARLAAMDLQWADLRPEKNLVHKLDQARCVRRLFSAEQVQWAADNPPSNTRAYQRGHAVQTDPDLVQASWTSLVRRDVNRGVLVRSPLPDPYDTGVA